MQLKSLIHDLGGEIVTDWKSDAICITESLSLPLHLEQFMNEFRMATPTWIHRMHQWQKLYPIECFSPDPKQIFSGFIVYGHKVQEY
jgi:hypothetical protein